jgi:hypothetical protein
VCRFLAQLHCWPYLIISPCFNRDSLADNLPKGREKRQDIKGPVHADG